LYITGLGLLEYTQSWPSLLFARGNDASMITASGFKSVWAYTLRCLAMAKYRTVLEDAGELTPR